MTHLFHLLVTTIRHAPKVAYAICQYAYRPCGRDSVTHAQSTRPARRDINDTQCLYAPCSSACIIIGVVVCPRDPTLVRYPHLRYRAGPSHYSTSRDDPLVHSLKASRPRNTASTRRYILAPVTAATLRPSLAQFLPATRLSSVPTRELQSVYLSPVSH